MGSCDRINCAAREQRLEKALAMLISAVNLAQVFDDDDRVERAIKRASEVLTEGKLDRKAGAA